MSITDLPLVNATLNATAACLLMSGWVAIRSGRVAVHKKLMIAAVTTSAVFLASYLTYHFNTAAVTTFPSDAYPTMAPVYYTILISHTILAVVILPMVIITLLHAVKDRLDRHRRLARWTLPIWIYVSITGVLIYLILYVWCV